MAVIKKKMMDGGKAKPMGGAIGAYSKLRGKDLELEKKTNLKFGDGPGSGPSGAMPKPKKKMGGMVMKKAEMGTKLTKPRKGEPSVKDIYESSKSNPKPMVGIRKAKSGGSFPDLNKDGKITQADILKGRGVIKKNGGSMKKCKYGCK